MCNTSCVRCRSSVHCQSENVSAHKSSGGGPGVRCVHDRLTFTGMNKLTFTREETAFGLNIINDREWETYAVLSF